MFSPFIQTKPRSPPNRARLGGNTSKLEFSQRLFTRSKIFLHSYNIVFAGTLALMAAFPPSQSRALAPDSRVFSFAVSKRHHHPPEAKNGNSAEYGSCIG